MNRRFGTVAIVLMALAALTAVCSFVFFSQPFPKNPATAATSATDDSSSSSSSSETINPDPSEPLPLPNSLPLVAATPRPDQPAKLKPQPPSRSPDWKLLDWSLKPLPEKPGVQLRASSYLASGKHPFVRVEQEIQILPNGEAKVLKTAEMVGDQIIVKLPEGSSAAEINSLATKLGGQAAAKPFAPDTWLISLPRKLEAVPEALVGSTNSGISIDYAEPNHLVRPMRTPNDPNFSNFNQWHLYNNSQIGTDIKAPKAWDRRTSAAYGTNKVIVAVIDSGVRYTHEDLLPNMWTNLGEITGDGLDNDGNGLIDDVYGADYRSNDGDPMTTDSHGTHCAGLIAAVGNNGLGITGVAWNGVQIMALRFIDVTGSLDDNVQSIDYAISKGARIINASYGAMYNPSRSEMEAIKRAENSGIILVAAAGNGTDEPYVDSNENNRYDLGETFTDWNSNGIWDKWYDNDAKPFFPASYSTYTFPRVGFTPPTTITLNNIISVGATDRNDAKAGFSNFGTNSVDLMAPGVEMWSTSISGTSNSYYTSGQGTSFAAPVVAGAVALLIAEYPGDSITSLRSKILAGVDVISGLSTLCATSGRLNLAKLLPANTNPLAVANAWHLPFNLETQISSTMRNPTNNLTPTGAITLHSGVQKFNNPDYGMANQTGGAVLYRTSVATAWITNTFRTNPVVNSGNNQYWSSVLSNLPAGTIQYVLRLDFDSGAQTTYAYAQTSSSSATTTNLTTAQASPFSFTVAKSPATVTLSGTNQTYNGSACPVTAATIPAGLTTSITYNGSSSAPTNAGSYPVLATINDSNYEGSATATLTIAKATSSISTAPTASPITYGQTLADSTLTGGTSTPAGSFAFTLPATAPFAGTSSHGITFTPTDTTNYLSATTTISVIINQAPTSISLAPSASPLRLGQTLASSTLTGGSASVAGTFTFTSIGTAPPLGTSSQSVTFTPNDSANFLSAVTSALVTVGGVENPTGDTDGDGLANLLEHALVEASTGTTTPSLLGQITTQSTGGSGSPETLLSLNVVVRTNDTNLLIYPEAALDLTSSNPWITNGFTTNTANQTNVPVGFQRREYQFNAGTNPRAFLKLTIQQQ